MKLHFNVEKTKKKKTFCFFTKLDFQNVKREITNDCCVLCSTKATGIQYFLFISQTLVFKKNSKLVSRQN